MKKVPHRSLRTAIFLLFKVITDNHNQNLFLLKEKHGQKLLFYIGLSQGWKPF